MSAEKTGWQKIAGKLHWLLFALALLLFMRDAFVLDDAYISFRYAKNLALHGQLTWNIGETPPVEGYTNFLWTLLIAGGIKLGLDPIAVSLSLGLLAAFCTLLLTWRLALELLHSRATGWLAIMLLAINYTFSTFATGGMETQLQTCLVTAFLYFSLRVVKQEAPSSALLAALSLIAAAGFLTRMDSAILIGPAFLIVLIAALKRRPFSAAPLILPALVIIGGWLAWKISYYGDILPNTFYVKGTGSIKVTAPRGYTYIAMFFVTYCLAPFPILGIFHGKSILAPGFRVMALTIALWLLYIIKVGGDFMEFRFMVPIMPMLFLLVLRLIYDFPARGVRAALIVLIVFGAVNHRGTFVDAAGVEAVQTLQGHVDNRYDRWPMIGKVLNKLFHGQNVTIATTAAGVIPYECDLPTVDMYGLSDLWIARHGDVVSSRPGHQKAPTLDYLIERKVNLVLGNPWQLKLDSLKTLFTLKDVSDLNVAEVKPEKLPETSRFIVIPLDGDRRLIVLYLVPHPAVDRAIAEFHFATYPIQK